MVCLLAAPLVQLSISAGNGWPHNTLQRHWLSCHFRDCKALLVTSLSHVSGAIASVQTLPFSWMSLGHTAPVISRNLLGSNGRHWLTWVKLEMMCYMGAQVRNDTDLTKWLTIDPLQEALAVG